MNGFLSERSLQPERMDLEVLDGRSAISILRTLETINTWLGGVQATLYHVRRWSRDWKPGERIRFIDWGTGGADIPRALIRWGRKHGFKFEVVGVDNNPAVLDYAREACKEYPEITIVEENLIEPPPLPSPEVGEGAHVAVPSPFSGEGGRRPGEGSRFDYALSSLCLHHLTDSQIIELLKKSHALASRGMIMNDLQRSVRAWMWIGTLTRLVRVHPIVQNDAPLSVRRAFRREELLSLASQAGLSYLKVKTHFGYRLTLAGERRRGNGETR